MRRIAAALAALALLLPAGSAGASADATVTVFAFGGTPLTNALYFPGTAVYDGEEFQGIALTAQKGSDLEFVNLDEATIANGHKLVSVRRNRRTGRPLFQSELLSSPGQTSLVITSHLKRGLYPFGCSVHDGMFGLLEIR